MTLDSNYIPPPPAFLHPPASILSNPPAPHLTFLTGHYVSGLISLQCIGAAKGLSLTRIESSHVFLLVCEIKPHLQPTCLSLPMPFTPACDSSPRYASFIDAICQALSCPRVFLDNPLCWKKKLFSPLHTRSLTSCMCAYACRHVSTDKREVCIPYGNGENFTDLGRTSFEHEWIQCLTCVSRTQPLTSSVSSILSVAISPGWPPGWSKVVPGQMHPLWSNSKNGGGSSPSWQEARTTSSGT